MVLTVDFLKKPHVWLVDNKVSDKAVLEKYGLDPTDSERVYRSGRVRCFRVDYSPSIYVSSSGSDVEELEGYIEYRKKVEGTGIESKKTTWRTPPENVLRIDLGDIDYVRDVAHEIKGYGEPGEYKLYDVDLSLEFRFCLDNSLTPIPETYSDLELRLPKQHISNNSLKSFEVDDRELEGREEDVLRFIYSQIKNRNPDILVVNHSELIPLLYKKAEEYGFSWFRLGRLDEPRYQELAASSTYTSYGEVQSSNARYNVPGRAIIDLSNTFFWNQTNLDGMFYLSKKSGKPIQELGWASIGNVFTAIQIQKARERGVLVPWNSWRHEKFKSMSTLHEADRGGFIFSPKTGIHRDVYELDFSSMYPNIIVTRNVSPDTVRCSCHDRNDVPGLDYSICDERGFLVDVLEPLIEDRSKIKDRIEEVEDQELEEELRGKSSAIKWILVSCFGYQGFSNAKFGRIECHESINAYAREILLETKEILEEHGWEVVHGIIDSIWVKPRDEPRDIEALCREVSECIGIELEFEARYSWIGFVPRRNEDSGALNRYFGKQSSGDFKIRGIEARQSSTPRYIKDCQKQFLEVLDEELDPEPVCEELKKYLAELERGEIDVSDLVVEKRVSKPLEQYQQYTRVVAALERSRRLGVDVGPGEKIRYVVVDDSKNSIDRVRLGYEEFDDFDRGFYRDLLVRCTVSILSVFGWGRGDVESCLEKTDQLSIDRY